MENTQRDQALTKQVFTRSTVRELGTLRDLTAGGNGSLQDGNMMSKGGNMMGSTGMGGSGGGGGSHDDGGGYSYDT